MNTIFLNPVIFHLCYSVQFIQHRYINIHSLDSTSTFEWLPETVGASLGDFYCEAGFQHTQLICLILLTFNKHCHDPKQFIDRTRDSYLL